MRWKSLHWLKAAACVTSAFSMCIAPVAHGKAAENNRAALNEFMKTTGLSTKVTVGDYWKQVRHAFPEPLKSQMDAYVGSHRNELMPKIEVTYVKDREGREQTRMLLTQNGQSSTITLTGDEAKPIKFNNVAVSAKELTDYKHYNRLAKRVFTEDPAAKKSLAANKTKSLIGSQPVMTYAEFSKLLPRQKAEFFFKLRLATDAASRVYKSVYGAQAAAEMEAKHKFAFEFLFGTPAEAASSLTGKPCVYAGYLTLYGENGSCGGADEGEKHFAAAKATSIASCSGKDVPCNPIVYGYDASGSNHCVPHAKRIDATAICNTKSPKDTPQDKKRIIETYLAKRGKKVNLALNDKGEVSKEQYEEISGYLTDLNKFIKDAVGECDNNPHLAIQKIRPDQKNACDAIRIRAFDLQKFATAPTPVILPPGDKPVAVNSCDIDKPGSEPDAQGNCVCNPATHEEKPGQKEDGTTGPTCVLIPIVAAGAGADIPGAKEDVPQKEEEDKKCSKWLCIGLPILALIGLATWAITKSNKKKKKKDEYVPPVATDPGTTPTTPTEPVTPINPPACAPPKQIINNVCTLPSIDVLPEPELSSEGGGLEALPGMGSGVR